MSNSTSLIQLSHEVSELASTIASYAETNDINIPNFAADSIEAYPHDQAFHRQRMKLIESLMNMLHLAINPSEFLLWHSLTLKHDAMVIDILNQFDFFNAVPVNGPTSYGAISRHTKLPESLVCRVLRHAMTLHLFAETAPGSGEIVHTSATAYAAKHPLLRSWLGLNMEEVSAGCLKIPEALRAYSLGKTELTQMPGECGIARAFYNPDGDAKLAEKTYFEWAENDGKGEEKGWRERRFGQAMQALAATTTVTPINVLKGLDWAALGNVTVVDVGGSVGHDSHVLASTYPNLKCIVQDVPGLASQFTAALPSDLFSRVSFRPHNFFSPQPVAADVYLFKHVLMNWQDDFAIKILRSLLPALRPGARVVVFDPIMAPAGAVPNSVERLMTSLDLQMLVACNGIYRSLEDWKALFRKADERFRLLNATVPPGSPFGLLEVLFDM